MRNIQVTNVHEFTHTDTYIYVYMQTHTYMYIRIHTHTFERCRVWTNQVSSKPINQKENKQWPKATIQCIQALNLYSRNARRTTQEHKGQNAREWSFQVQQRNLETTCLCNYNAKSFLYSMKHKLVLM